MHIHVTVQTANFDLQKESDLITEASGDAGALVLFQGMVREFDQETPLEMMTLEHFPGLQRKRSNALLLKQSSDGILPDVG